MLLSLTKSHYGSLSQNIPEVKLHNMYISENPLSPDGFSYVTRPVVNNFVDFNNEIVRGVYYQQGFLNDSIMVVAGNTLYAVNDEGVKASIGFIAGSDLCYFSSTIYGVGIIGGGVLYVYDGISLVSVEVPDSLIPATITSLNNYFIIAIKNSNKFFWIEPGEVVIDGLSFASAESNPDDIVGIKTVSDELWILGKESAEVWAVSGDVNAPFLRISGRVFNKGCFSESSITLGVMNSLPCLIWVSNSKEVLLGQGSPAKISNEFVEEMLKLSSYARGWFFQRQRNDFYVLSTDIITLVFDLTNQVWYKWSTLGQDTWKVSSGVQKGTNLYGCDGLESSFLFKLVEGVEDNETEWLVCEVTGFLPHNKLKPVSCGSIDLYANPGFSSSYTTDPIVELRWSDDQGVNWSSYMQASLGVRGNSDNTIKFRSLGSIKTPGRRFEFRFSLAEAFRLDYALVNGET